MSPPAITVEFQPQADGRIEVQTKTSLTGQSLALVTPPFRGPMQRQAVALALEAVSFDPSVWQTIPQVFQALKDLGLGSDSGFTAFGKELARRCSRRFFRRAACARRCVPTSTQRAARRRRASS